MRGLKNANIKRLKAIFHIDSIELVSNDAISEDTFRLKVFR